MDMGLLWVSKTYIKINASLLTENLYIKKIYDFQKGIVILFRLCKGFQSCSPSNFEDDSIFRNSILRRTRVVRGGPSSRIIFQISNFDSL